MPRERLDECVEVEIRAFFDYIYLTLFFPDDAIRRRFMQAGISAEFRANLGEADHLMAVEDGRVVAVAQLHSPEYRKPSMLKYMMNGLCKVLRCGDCQAAVEWLKMDEQAAAPCHEKSGQGIWYLSTFTVSPDCQGQGVGSRLISDGLIPYIKARGGRTLVTFTNSEENCRFYEKNGFSLFHKTTISHNGKSMGCWSYERSI